MTIDPTKDGIDHLNVYSKARTELGRWMSNWTEEPIETEDGCFKSIEGYWYWLGTHNEEFRRLSGWLAKSLGKDSPKTIILSEIAFQDKIRKAITLKALNRPDQMEKLKNCKLPLRHYYVYGDVVRSAGHKWILDIWNELRK